MTKQLRDRRFRAGGSTIIEFALVALLLCLLLVAFVDLGRMMLVYESVANAARAGVRYAIVHGANRSGGGLDGPSGPGNTGNVETVVKNFAGSAPLNRTRVSVTVTYPDGSNTIGSSVEVRVVYPYDPLVGYFPLTVDLGSLSRGVVAY